MKVFKTLLSMDRSTLKCLICGRNASCHNYGVLTCNACKMFFRRVVIEQITYQCRNWKKCLENADQFKPRCKACRFEKCVRLGMKLGPIAMEKLYKTKPMSHPDFATNALIQEVLYLNYTKRYKLCNFYTSENPTLEEMVQTTFWSGMKRKTEKQEISVAEWSFQATYIAVETFLSLEFMNLIENDEKVVLLRNFSSKSIVLDSAMRALNAKVDRVTTPDGEDIYSDIILSMFSAGFLNSIQCGLVSRVAELKVTELEHAMLSVLLFCNPDLLSISHVINKTSEDANSLTTLCQLYFPKSKLKHLLIDTCINA
ncbi:Nuclear Hormone Receptor family [Caenorhabditis elegans]|uniref:Nuclear Hormone Receptor family n=1 Tax=Caenorhabditis elegans TaxID=6239 RepID=A0A168H5N7_CAEEL|nr:Nuclear Hormone Receptor family [Caenorhabditis elegans]SAP35579.1 Nuclear Hormone Receptor family [Caenorhabditis elegans]|eukprot:NP_001317819.1 Nuclear Hormone Receptor family [Caenorhabditis elegans]